MRAFEWEWDEHRGLRLGGIASEHPRAWRAVEIERWTSPGGGVVTPGGDSPSLSYMEILIGRTMPGITIDVPTGPPPDPGGYWWLPSEVSVHVNSWRGRYTAHFVLQDFETFANGLLRMNNSASGAALLASRERDLTVDLRADRLGLVDAGIEVVDRSTGDDVHVRFHLAMDQTDLAPILASVDDLLTRLTELEG
jgi:hypothetical protein